jgi:hypothetical protein
MWGGDVEYVNGNGTIGEREQLPGMARLRKIKRGYTIEVVRKVTDIDIDDELDVVVVVVDVAGG